MDASGAHRNDDDDGELPLELQPKFTEQDEQRELATLTIQDLTELQSDLTGIQAITNGFSGLGFGGDTSEINVYGGESTDGPGSSSPASTLAGAMRDEVVNMAKSGFFQLMPNTDAAGRAIIYCRAEKRDFSQYSVRQEVVWLTYLLEIVVRHKSLQSRGFVLLLDLSNASRKHYKRQSDRYFQRAFESAFPIRMRLHHVCNANPFVNYVVFPVARRVLSKNMRMRTRFHRGSGEDLLRSLAEYNLPRNRVPSDMGGSVLLGINQFLLDRFSLEASRAGINLQPSETDNVDQADRAGTLSSAAPHHNWHEQAPPSAGGAVAVADSRGTKARSKRNGARNIVDPRKAKSAASRSTRGRSKRTGPRNVVDPRMAKAVRAKQEDPDLSLHDALISGGFVFAQKGSKTTDNDMFDENDVSLKQRKNNLCRRLREERENEKKKASNPVDGGKTSVTQNQDSAAAMARRDSFDEAIQGLPGLDALGGGDLDVAFNDELAA